MRTIVLALDESQHSRMALDFALQRVVHRPISALQLHLVTVLPPLANPMPPGMVCGRCVLHGSKSPVLFGGGGSLGVRGVERGGMQARVAETCTSLHLITVLPPLANSMRCVPRHWQGFSREGFWNWREGCIGREGFKGREGFFTDKRVSFPEPTPEQACLEAVGYFGGPGQGFRTLIRS